MDIEQVKEANAIEDVIYETYPLKGTGRYLRPDAPRGQGLHSLIVDTHNQAYFWNSKGEQGDVISWVMVHQNCDFKEAVRALCQRAGLVEPQWGKGAGGAAATARRARAETLTVMARELVRMLRDSDEAAAYCRSRGWTDETIQGAGLGFTGPECEKRLRGALSMYELDQGSDAAKAMLGIREGMLVYPHVERGRVVYSSARSIDADCPKERAHFNPPVALIGDRQVYVNWVYSPRCEDVVVVEGQADAVTLGQWGVSAVALAGVSVNQAVLKMLARAKRVFVGLDEDEAGIRAARMMCDALGPLTRWVEWPENDANGWLQAGATRETCAALLAAADTWVEVVARAVGTATNGQRSDALRRACRVASRLDDFDLATYKKGLTKTMGVGLREFDRMLKAIRADADAEDDDLGEPLVTMTVVGGQLQVKGSDDYYLLETLYRPPDGSAGAAAISGGKTLFAIREPGGEIKTAPYLDVDGVRYVAPPPEAQMLVKRVVSFADRVGPSIPLRELVEEVRTTIHKYVDIDPFFERLSAYYVVFTWLYDCFNTLPYLRFRGDYGTGKSRARKVIGTMCFRPMRASGAATVSPIFRMIDVWRGTLLVEEADYSDSDYGAEIIKIYNQGYDREQGIVLRSGDKNTGFETEAFVCYGPKILAMRGEFKDAALTSRFLTKDMGGATTRPDIPIEMPREFELEEAPRMRSLLLRYRLENWQPDIKLNLEALDLGVEPRLNQIVLSLYSLVDEEGLLEELKDFVRVYNAQLIEERGLTLVAKVLEGLLVQYHLEQGKEDEKKDLSTLTVTKRVNQLIDFENLGYVGYANRNPDKGVKDRKVGSILRKQLQLTSTRNSRFNGRHVVVWAEDRIGTLRKRFGLDDERLVALLEIIHKLDMADVQPGQDEMQF